MNWNDAIQQIHGREKSTNLSQFWLGYSGIAEIEVYEESWEKAAKNASEFAAKNDLFLVYISTHRLS